MAAKAKRRLSDLYVIGREVTFDDGAGDPITVFIRKMNPIDHETAFRYGNAARARTMAIKGDPTSNDYQDVLSGLIGFSHDDLVNFLCSDFTTKREPILRAELAADEAWSKDDRLEGLQDAWANGLSARFMVDPKDPDAAAVHKALDEFDDLVTEARDAALAKFRKDTDPLPEQILRDQVFEKMLDMQASMAWFMEFRRCEVWLSTREPDQRSPYFHNRDEVDALPQEIFDGIQAVYREIAVDPVEGKASPVEAVSSPSSEDAATPETDDSSGLVTATA